MRPDGVFVANPLRLSPTGRRERTDCAVRFCAPARLRDLAAHFRASFAFEPSAPRSEGAGNAGRSDSARSLVCEIKKHTSVVTTVTPETPGIPRAMVLTVSFGLSSVTGLSCHRRPRKLPSANLTPASGRQDHTSIFWHSVRHAETNKTL